MDDLGLSEESSNRGLLLLLLLDFGIWKQQQQPSLGAPTNLVKVHLVSLRIIIAGSSSLFFFVRVPLSLPFFIPSTRYYLQDDDLLLLLHPHQVQEQPGFLGWP